LDGKRVTGRDVPTGHQTSNRTDRDFDAESERKIVNVDSESFVLEERKVENQTKPLGITKVTEVEVEFKDHRKL
jgi:hypothetical protein